MDKYSVLNPRKLCACLLFGLEACGVGYIFSLYVMGVTDSGISTFFAALIPLTELSDPNIMKKYGVQPDPESLDIVNTAARQKEVQLPSPSRISEFPTLKMVHIKPN